MRIEIRRSFKILAPGNSLRRRTAYSLVLVRLILAPVIFLTVYYLFQMGWIVNHIVNTDAPAETEWSRECVPGYSQRTRDGFIPNSICSSKQNHQRES
jgi:hypothetical protein